MRVGKVSYNILKRSVLKKITSRRKETIISPNIGSDCANIKLSDGVIGSFITNPIIGELDTISDLAVYRILNDLTTSNSETIGILTSYMLPETITENMLKASVMYIDTICEKYNIDIIGGHTEVSPYISKPMITVTGIGRALYDVDNNVKKVKESDDIILTKWIGLEGTIRIAREKEEELLSRYNKKLINQAKELYSYLSIIEEAKIANEYASYMKNLSTGGIYASLWELATATNMGFEVMLDNIPIKQETIEVCEFYDLNPYKLLSSGALLIVSNQGNKVVELLKKEGITANIIGKMTSSNDKIIVSDEKQTCLEPSRGDEWYKIKQF